MVTSYSLLTLRQALAEEAFLGQHPIRITTTGAGSTTTVVIADLAFTASGVATNDYHGCWLYNTAAAPTAPFSSRVDQQNGLAVATGTLTCHPAFGAAPGSGTEVIFCYDLHPDELHKAINRVLRNLSYFAYLPVTLVTDGSMEATGTANWTPVGGATLTKVASPFLVGRQALHVVAGGVSQGASAVTVPVIAGESLLLSVPVRLTTIGSVQVILRDETSLATIGSATISETQPVSVRFFANVPASSESVGVRFISTAAATFDVGPVTLLSQNRHRYALEAGSVERGADVMDVVSLPWAQSAVAADSYYSMVNANRDRDYLIEEDVRAGSPTNIVLPTYPTEPYFMRVQRRFPELLVDAANINATTNTVSADRDTVVQGAMFYLERARYARIVGTNPPLAAEHLGRAREYARRFTTMRLAQGYGPEVREMTPARRAVTMAEAQAAAPRVSGYRE